MAIYRTLPLEQYINPYMISYLTELIPELRCTAEEGQKLRNGTASIGHFQENMQEIRKILKNMDNKETDLACRSARLLFSDILESLQSIILHNLTITIDSIKYQESLLKEDGVRIPLYRLKQLLSDPDAHPIDLTDCYENIQDMLASQMENYSGHSLHILRLLQDGLAYWFNLFTDKLGDKSPVPLKNIPEFTGQIADCIEDLFVQYGIKIINAERENAIKKGKIRKPWQNFTAKITTSQQNLLKRSCCQKNHPGKKSQHKPVTASLPSYVLINTPRSLLP